MKEVFDNEMKLEFISKSSNEAFASSVAYLASFNAIASLFHQFISPFTAATNKAIAAIVNSFNDNLCKVEILNKTMNNEYTGDNSLLLKNYPNIVFTPMDIGLKKLFEYNKQFIKGEQK